MKEAIMIRRRSEILALLSTVLAVTSGIVAAPTARAATIVAADKLPVSGLRDHDHFGSSVALLGAFAVVGAPGDDTRGTDAGAAYVFSRSGSTWSQVAKLHASDALAGDEFGKSVDVTGDSSGIYVAIGAPNNDNPAGSNAGAAYIFHSGDGAVWSEKNKNHVEHNRGENDNFGSAVTIAGTEALIGIPLDDTPDPTGRSGSGSVSVSVLNPLDNNWNIRSSLDAGVFAGDWQRFGTAVDMAPLTAVAGAPGTVDNRSASAVHVFARPNAASPWMPQARLTPTADVPEVSFGISVAVSGNTLIVGDPDVRHFSGQGTVQFFARSGSTWVPTLSDLGPGNSLAFGRSVAISGHLSGGESAIVGAPATRISNVFNVGTSYVYHVSGSMVTQQDIVAAGPAEADSFGQDVDVSAGTALIGAPNDDVMATDSGSVYIAAVP